MSLAIAAAGLRPLGQVLEPIIKEQLSRDHNRGRKLAMEKMPTISGGFREKESNAQLKIV